MKRYWTFEKCKEIALKYQHKRDFKKYDSTAYCAAIKYNWIDDICGHMMPLYNAYYRCIYSYEFIETKSVYVGLTYSMKERKRKRINRTGDTVTIYINKTGYIPIYKQLTDYIEVEKAIILEGEWLKKYKDDGWNILNRAKTGGLGWSGKKHKYDNLEYVKSIIKEYKSVGDLMKRNNALYLKIGGNKWRDIIYPMLNYKKRYPSSFWTKENIIKFSKNKTRKEFSKEYICAYRIALKNNWDDEIWGCSKIHRPNYWNFMRCKNEALKYNKRNEFQKQSGTAYQAARRHKWLDEITSHMVKDTKCWTKEKCSELALLCTSKSEFRKKYIHAYDYARKHKFLEEITKHLEKKKKWNFEECKIISEKSINKN